jgi:Zn-dependent protease with chaperone function
MNRQTPPAPPGWNKTIHDLFDEAKKTRSTVASPEVEWARDFERGFIPAGTRFPKLADVYEATRDVEVRYLTSWSAPFTGGGSGTLEKRWRYAAMAVLVIAVGTVGFVRYGAPMLAERAMRFIPPAMDSAIGADSLAILDRSIFKPSKHKSDRQVELKKLFAEVSAGASAESGHFRLEMRDGGSIKANALALPSGIVVLTDELEHLAINDNELRGVFGHEVGHLVNRHAMRRLVQSSAAAWLLGGIFGDVIGVSTLVTAVPTVLVNSAYSRDFEREADEFAFRWMSQHNVAPAELGNLLTRLTKAGGEERGGYLASHPSLPERVKAAEASNSTASEKH